MAESVSRASRSTVDKATAAWIDYKNQLRLYDLCSRLFKQDLNLENALAELNELKSFIADPEHILGSELTKHGEIAEHYQVNISNARNAILGLEKEYSSDGVGRTAPEDYLRNGEQIQSKFCNGIKNTLRAVKKHSETYPDFVSNGGSYDIPKDQWEEMQEIIYRSKNKPSSLSNSEWSQLQAINEFEKDTGLSVSSDLAPSVADYNQVQQNEVNAAIDNEKQLLDKKDQEQRQEAYRKTAPSLKEGAKVAGTSAAVEGGLCFCICVFKKLRSGKHLYEFDENDWIEIAKETGFGIIKGGIRGTSVYLLTNFTNTSANLASAYTTAAIGVVSQLNAYERGAIAEDTFLINSEIMCLDIAISTLSSYFGQMIIPIPILGAVIGNIIGETLYGICIRYAEKKEEALVEEMNSELTVYTNSLKSDLQKTINDLLAYVTYYNGICELAFNSDVNKSFWASILLAKAAGVSDSKILHTVGEIDTYFLS